MPAATTSAPLPKPLIIVMAAMAVLSAVALGLWAYFGTALFLEMVRAGWAACF